ncbi:hypothetical protein [Streptomyces liangshanensis]|uniref:hypothetical protein n=1 Tax=Streptomyces liangshanensis TaxID=2717324 RepID=UPI0036DBC90A
MVAMGEWWRWGVGGDCYRYAYGRGATHRGRARARENRGADPTARWIGVEPERVSWW